jgi:hypothetical protein
MNILYHIAARLLALSNRPEVLTLRSSELTRLVNAIDAKLRKLDARDLELPQIRNVDGQPLVSCVMGKSPPWSGEILPKCQTPGMVTDEECQYYVYMGRFYTGVGEVVELGPWLGRSTFYIVDGLSKNPHFAGKRLAVYDDFVWRSSWMDAFVPNECGNHADFRYLFEKHSQPIRDKLDVHKRKITTYDGNDSVEQLRWDGRPIEMIYVDCGRTFEANEAWWSIFSASFIPERTLIILQDWRTHSSVPVLWYNQIKQWVDSKGHSLKMVHELRNGGVGTFLYMG